MRFCRGLDGISLETGSVFSIQYSLISFPGWKRSFLLPFTFHFVSFASFKTGWTGAANLTGDQVERGLGLGIVLQSNDYITLFMSFFNIPVGLDDLL